MKKQLKGKKEKQVDFISYFDASYYLFMYEDIKESEVDPFEHFMKIGFKEGRNPNRWFQIDYYLQSNPDVRANGENPFLHYLNFGWKEGRLPNSYVSHLFYEEIESLNDIKNYFTEEKIFLLDNKDYLDSEFYTAYYQDLKALKTKKEALLHWEKYGKLENRLQNLKAFCNEISFPYHKLPDLKIDIFHKLNPLLSKLNYTEAMLVLLQTVNIELVRITEDKLYDSRFYLNLAEYYISKSQSEKAYKLLTYSIYLKPSSKAYELTGNHHLGQKDYKKAIIFYKYAIAEGSTNFLVWHNIHTAFIQELKYDDAIGYLRRGLKYHPTHSNLLKSLDKTIDIKWEGQQDTLRSLAAVNDRRQLEETVGETVNFYARTYAEVFSHSVHSRISADAYLPKKILLNPRKVLIIGDHHIPQCVRYRIDQKAEQLRYINYDVTVVSWTDLEKSFDELFFNDIVIYYRVPAFPIIIKSIEKAKSLHKITFYEIDDLIFDEVYPAPYEEYGGNISLDEYNGLVYGMPLFKMAATLCEFAIGSTLPLLNHLEPLVLSKKGFLHRNGLDKNNNFSQREQKEYVNIFYGSGTLAHNSDFIDLALSPIEKILRENSNVKLNIIGHLNLPESFLIAFQKQVNMLPKTETIEHYWIYLSDADINLAVLQSNEINDAKSELKWFEAACFEIPSIVSNTKNYLDILEDGVDALIAETQEDWYNALHKLVNNKQLRKDIGKKAFLKVQEEYSVKNLSKNIHRIIQTALEERGQR